MAQIVSADNLYEYSIALRNSGITVSNLQMLERQILIFIFGKEGALALVREINANTVQSPKVKELLDGDDELFSGLRALLATIICTNLLSQNRILVGRQNVAKRPLTHQVTTRREESDVIQALAYSAKSIIFAMHDYLKKEGKNPLDLKIARSIFATRYATNTSGYIPANTPGFMGFLGWW